ILENLEIQDAVHKAEPFAITVKDFSGRPIRLNLFADSLPAADKFSQFRKAFQFLATFQIPSMMAEWSTAPVAVEEAKASGIDALRKERLVPLSRIDVPFARVFPAYIGFTDKKEENETRKVPYGYIRIHSFSVEASDAEV